ncbi:MAG: 1-deoxy-D-xylulose-5-phosphate synthase [Parasporobacterium sp.]|nr:1-deoxy-D-xylulose-5-phosphate synthase [Parasporobacterium sp.]
MILDTINKANDIKNTPPDQLNTLAREIRRFLVQKVSRTGGHLASNLAVVELTMALHLSLDLDKDKIIWDVGHQSYVHKILTGRRKDFNTLRQYGGMSGFPKRRESEYDTFNTGHSSTSIAAAIGMAQAAYLKGEDTTVACVIGDGAMTGGLAFEALNNASKLNRNLLIILNDNNMSISENVGGLSSYFSKIRAGETYNDIKAGVVDTLTRIPYVGGKMVSRIRNAKSSLKQLIVPGMIFENMGITYLGPINGHDTMTIKKMIDEAKKLDHPVVIHVCTKKGKGYRPAEADPGKFHGISPFDIKTGEVLKKKSGPTYTDIFSESICRLAASDENIIGITAAMSDGTGLTEFSKLYPERFFDVGIAEEFAVTFAAGMAASGLKPFVAIYSSFLQRAYDQILHDVCIQDLPVVFCIDRAGLVGNDGETHQGQFDISYLSTIPNMSIFAPMNAYELGQALEFAAGYSAPLALRYPRGEAYTGLEEHNSPIVYGKSQVIYLERDIAIISVGSMMGEALKVREALKEKGLNVSLVNARFIKPVDEDLINELMLTHKTIITMEENIISGGYGSNVLNYVNRRNKSVKVINFGIPNSYIEQGSQSEQLKECGLDSQSILNKLDGILK